MSNDTGTVQPAAATPRLPLDAVVAAIASATRWSILRELSAGEQLAVIEIAERVGISPNLTSRHMAVLRKAGLAVVGRNRLYRIPQQYLPAPGQRLVDLGHCLLRFDQKASP